MKIDLIKTLKYIDKDLELYGWIDVRRDHGKLIFFDLRDRSGKVQLVVTPNDPDLHKIAETLRPEWVVKISGKVVKRPDAMKNLDEPTGEIEIKVSKIEVLTQAKTPPFELSTDGYEIGEEVRMQYRYLDLRRPRLKKNLIERARVIKFIRDFLAERDFIEVETPILSKSTPEGARDYLVPSRLHQGNFYALPQSPQQYKQLLMVAGIEKYFQIARCFRDEDTRGDRQPEFTQFDLEMSFVQRDDILSLTEDLYLAIAKKLYPNKKLTLTDDGKIPRMTHKEAMEKYSSDKPDIRKDKNDPDELAFLFVLDFPAFEWKETEKRWDSTHHPFTKPQVKDTQDFWQKFKSEPGDMLADQYDFVLNGYEIGGGSIRIHDPELLKAVFEALGNNKEDIEKQFGHMFEAFSYGVPPHGGIAPGIDRLVMILMNEPNIREVIAFPKTGDGRDLMMRAPSAVDKKQLDEIGIEIKKK
ncbi:hypothetical protein A3I27_03320 [Candidatus Giovannonibacteria bacterium RIFCSPLOWO2_02_FULL_43_11b]|uniref:Aspartate--tRNA(Asp/Asn) ligase n=1 Tax=Candidatus Giovannonibacteria bacterium RIFCSPHIGHO2_12_FULL_43_15 TaxID=1798341 RepID=A0A1F5WNY6_9BACT|nr:MAG: hypothetical protein A2739_02745 [Candidatus Giovannonibacteria bacterium RIFCSPHIGHO2_01_FULL_43_100]OGF77307.1 MAG: hypothetical protein A3F23_00440 [Candidatus Giovannonibacteria bacterium RIFCSPHIGHO2_12_FULL_43_15]OGF78028.1 MAG: hypothetical protein A3A15_01225 [Candidatus Giovannonibacteria bacterium RIFCSPLOWO2_01_FULL_43_60]OGF89751.1 MAG: hypothetical protein A3I27_03320 [Candidatus Giovannonibacteria bacterium RIFCSPLOWO2_02_FULL_43_11b]OGF91753.1 MAG: hypothetical protein A3